MDRSVSATTSIALPFSVIREALVGGACTAPRDGVDAQAHQPTRVAEPLFIPTDDGFVEREVTVTCGDAEASEHHLVVPLEWHATRFGHVFPSFEGFLRADGSDTATTFALKGRCTIPLGEFGDGVVARRLARNTVAAELQAVLRRLEASVGAVGPTPYVVTHDEPGPG